MKLGLGKDKVIRPSVNLLLLTTRKHASLQARKLTHPLMLILGDYVTALLFMMQLLHIPLLILSLTLPIAINESAATGGNLAMVTATLTCPSPFGAEAVKVKLCHRRSPGVLSFRRRHAVTVVTQLESGFRTASI